MDILFYVTATGSSPVRKYIEALKEEEQSEITSALALVEKGGLQQNIVRTKPIQEKLWELIIGQQRIFYILVKGPTMVLLHAYKKQSQKAPKGEIALAKKRMKEILLLWEKEGK